MYKELYRVANKYRKVLFELEENGLLDFDTQYTDVEAYFSFEQIEEIDMAFEVSTRTYEPERYKTMCSVKSLNLYKGWCAFCSCLVCRLYCLKKMIGDVKYG